MAASLEQIRAGLATLLSNQFGDGVQVSPYMLGNPTPPTIQVMGPDEIQWDLAMQRGLDKWMIILQGFVGSPTDIGAQKKLDTWLAPTGGQSVKAAIEADKTLGNIVPSADVITSSGYRIYNLDNRGTTLGAEWTVSVLNTGS